MFHDNTGLEWKLINKVFAFEFGPLFLISTWCHPNNSGLFNIVDELKFIMFEVFLYELMISYNFMSWREEGIILGNFFEILSLGYNVLLVELL